MVATYTYFSLNVFYCSKKTSVICHYTFTFKVAIVNDINVITVGDKNHPLNKIPLNNLVIRPVPSRNYVTVGLYITFWRQLTLTSFISTRKNPSPLLMGTFVSLICHPRSSKPGIGTKHARVSLVF